MEILTIKGENEEMKIEIRKKIRERIRESRQSLPGQASLSGALVLQETSSTNKIIRL